jgi:hypothetical protein
MAGKLSKLDPETSLGGRIVRELQLTSLNN